MSRIIVISLLFVGLEAIDLQCKFEKMYWGIETGTGCTVSNLNITSQETITSVNGQTVFNGSNYNMISIEKQVVNVMPEGLEKFFPNIEGLLISDSKLAKVGKKDMQKFPKLRQLYLASNNLRFLPGDLFDGNLELKQVNFNMNPITFVGHNLVTPLEKLEYATFFSTKCISKSYFPYEISSLADDLRENCPEPALDVICGNAEQEEKMNTLEGNIATVGKHNAELEEKNKKLERIVDSFSSYQTNKVTSNLRHHRSTSNAK
jgi:hypothetical protein